MSPCMLEVVYALLRKVQNFILLIYFYTTKSFAIRIALQLKTLMRKSYRNFWSIINLQMMS